MSTHNEVYGMCADKDIIVTQVGLYSDINYKELNNEKDNK
jgi:hypothetical protein